MSKKGLTVFLNLKARLLTGNFTIKDIRESFATCLSGAPNKNYRKLHCSAALTLSHIEYL